MIVIDTPHTNIVHYLGQFRQQTPDQEALVFADHRLTYAELDEQVQRCAAALIASGINKGDRVAVLCTSRPEYWITFLATTSIGAIWLGLNPKYRPPEIRYVLEDAKPTLLFAMARFESSCFEKTVRSLRQDYPLINTVVSLTETLPDTISWSEFLALGDSTEDGLRIERQSQVEAMDPALLVYTSGTTGQPKGALLSHYGLCFGATVQNQHFAVKQPKILCNFPINHVACVADTCCVNLIAGGTLVFQERFEPAEVLRAIEQERLTFFGGVPTMLLLLLEHPNFAATDFSSLELIGWGGAALPVPIIKRLQKLAPRLINVYGMTETAANTCYTSPDADLIELSETIGRPSPHMPCRIVDTQGIPCKLGQTGELQFKGPYLLLEYFNRPEATRAAFTEDGWLHTGDLGYWREEGTITLVGRSSDMYKSGGYNVYPREVEAVLESYPTIEMAAVVAVPDTRYQEVGAAYFVAPDTIVADTALSDYCRQRLANYKIPKYFKQLDTLPMLPVGKVDKAALKALTGRSENRDTGE